MEKKRRIPFYTDMNGPHEAQVREMAAMTPEERWEVFLKMKRLHAYLFGPLKRREKRITISRPSWM